MYGQLEDGDGTEMGGGRVLVTIAPPLRRARNGPLIVAMQPGIDIDEVIVVGEAGEEVITEEGAINAMILGSNADDVEYVVEEVEVAGEIEVADEETDHVLEINLEKDANDVPSRFKRPKKVPTILSKQRRGRRKQTWVTRSPVKTWIKSSMRLMGSGDSDTFDVYDGPSHRQPKKREFAHR